jgi:mRNA-degrading endonuclease toxin of MazEF toxin-antitoxin module
MWPPRSATAIALVVDVVVDRDHLTALDLLGDTPRVLVEQAGAVDASRLGELIGSVSPEQQWGIGQALLTVLGPG